MDNLIGLDNDYLSAGERLGQEFNEDEIGFLKNAGISAYEGAKKAVTQPLTTAEELLAGLYDSGVNIASTLGTDPTYLDDALREMYGVGYDEATDEQVNRAREALFGDVLNVGSVATGLGAASRGIAGIADARDAEWRDTLSKYEERAAASQRSLEAFREEAAQREAEREARSAARWAVQQNEDDLREGEDEIQELFLRNEAAGRTMEELLTREAEGVDLNPYERERIEAYRLNQQRQQQLPPDFGPTIEEMLPADPVVGPDIDFDIDDPGPNFDIDIDAEPQTPAIPVQNMMDQGLLLQDVRPKTGYEVRPTIGQAEGIASLYSPTRKAVDLLDRPSYDDLDSLRVQLLNRGAKPDELERLMAKIPGTKNNPMSAEQVEAFLNDPKAGQFSKEDLARFADEASQDVVVSTRTAKNSPRDSAYLSGFFLKGAEDMGSNVFELSTQAPSAAFKHFKPSEKGRAPVLHTRFGMFRSPGADKPDTYHLGEIQSDWAQTRQKLFPTQEAFKKAKERYLEADNRLMDLISQRRQMESDWVQKHGALSPSFMEDPRFSNTPNIFEDAEYQSLEKALEKAQEEASALNDKIISTHRNGTRDRFDATYSAPYVGTTSKWVQLGLRQSLLDAVNKGAKRMTLSTGEQVRGYTRGKESGQNKFYDVIVPKELDEVLRKFAKEAGIRKPEITTSKIVGDMFQEYMVPTVEFTDEFVEALKRVGLPAYAKGGIVKGSYLDNDPLEPALY